MHDRAAPFTTDPTVARFEPLVQAAADAALVLVAIWAFYRVMWGHGIFTQFTARIMLPRIVLAALLINLSTRLVQGAIDFENAICMSVERLAGSTLDFGRMVGVWGNDLAPGPPLGPAVVLVLLGGFVLLAISYAVRYALLVLLAILAPLAALTMVLPETHHYAREWASLFVSTLLMQPMQLLILTIGLDLELSTPSPIRHGFALAALWMCFKVPGALHSASTVGSHAGSFARRHALKLAHAAAKL